MTDVSTQEATQKAVTVLESQESSPSSTSPSSRHAAAAAGLSLQPVAALLDGLVICLVGYYNETDGIKALIHKWGGEYSQNITQDCTHAIVQEVGGKRYKTAHRINLPMVSKAWLLVSIKEGKLEDVNKWQVGTVWRGEHPQQAVSNEERKGGGQEEQGGREEKKQQPDVTVEQKAEQENKQKAADEEKQPQMEAAEKEAAAGGTGAADPSQHAASAAAGAGAADAPSVAVAGRSGGNGNGEKFGKTEVLIFQDLFFTVSQLLEKSEREGMTEEIKQVHRECLKQAMEHKNICSERWHLPS